MNLGCTYFEYLNDRKLENKVIVVYQGESEENGGSYCERDSLNSNMIVLWLTQELIFVQRFIVDNYSGPEIIIEKIISISNDLPYNFNQYYLWNSDNTNIATVNQFGKVKAINNGGCIISGNYTPNSMVIVKIYITVV